MSNPNFRTLDLNLLRVFDEVMAERSLTRAARNLSLTQPAVSNALRRLRETLGDELVQRSDQGMAPTPRARAIWPAVREALRQLQESLIPNEFVPANANNNFVLAMADATAAELIPGLAETLEQEAPGVGLRVVPLATRDPRRLLDEETCDLAIGYFPAALADLTARAQSGEPVQFLHQRLYDGEYVCVMRNGHPLARGPLTLNRFCAARHMLVSFSGRPYGFIDESLASLGRERQVVLTVNQFFTAGRVVATSNLLTVLPRHFVRVTGIAEQLVLRPLPFDVSPVHVDAVWHRRSQQRSAHIWLRQAVVRAAAQAFAAGTGVDPAQRADPDCARQVFRHLHNRQVNIQLMSDLHLEVNPHFVPQPLPGADVLVLAGDIGSYQQGSGLAALAEDRASFGLRRFSPLPVADGGAGWPTPVIFVPGNHEYDTFEFDEAHARLRATCEQLGMLWLERESIVLAGVRFVGTTLWSDFDALEVLDPSAHGPGGASPWAASVRAKRQERAFRAANFYLQKTGTRYRGAPMLAEEVRQQSLVCQQWLRGALSQPFDGTTVVVTHFAPSLLSADPRYGLTPGTAGFCNSLDDLLPHAAAWLHGHLHCRVDYRKLGCRVVANPLGYARKGEQEGFRPDLCIQV